MPLNTKSQAAKNGSAARSAAKQKPTQAKIDNFRTFETDEGVSTRPKSLNEIVTEIHAATGDWPRRVGSTLFVDDGNSLRMFDRERAAGLFAWLRSYFPINWKRGGNFVTQLELFSQLYHVAKKYEAVALYPHEPMIDGVYYRCASPAIGDGSYLEKFVDVFRPDTALDRVLIKAAILTVFWGGAAGMRPAFVITSDDGRGVGKTKLAALIAQLVGGSLDVDAGCDITTLKERLLSPEGQTKRIALLDNIKSLKFSWAELEKLITAQYISGKQMYVGEGQRPNYITWFMTLNGVALGDDMAQRSVVIKVVRGENSGTWYDDAVDFIDKYRQEIIGDVIAALRAPRNPLDHFKRWATWEREVLQRLPQPNDVQQLILNRQNESNCELDEADLIEEYFAERLRARGFNTDRDTVHIPSSTATDWFNHATGEKVKIVAASKRLTQLASEKANQSGSGKFKRIRVNPSRSEGRGYLWIGETASADDPVKYELKRGQANDTPEF